jgi:hypothetical protein
MKKRMTKKDRSGEETEENGRITGGICGKTRRKNGGRPGRMWRTVNTRYDG